MTSSLLPFPGPCSVQTFEGITSLLVAPGHVDAESVHLDVENISAAQDFMVIDLSDNVNWPHTNTGHIDILYILINVSPSTNFSGDVELGFLSNVDGTNGDFHGIAEYHVDQKVDQFVDSINFGSFELSLEKAHWFGPTTADDVAFQTDVDLDGPDGNNSFPSGNGDMIMRVGVGAGNVSVGITVGYRTHA